jgi:regulator of protease activity HflC (stomatin/prohibitin superfamily)
MYRDIWWTKKRLYAAVLIVIIIFASALTILTSVKIVPAGYKGILLTWGNATSVLDEGLHFVTPIAQNVALMNIQIQKAESTEGAASSDLQDVSTTIAVNYRLNPQAVLQIYKDLREDYEFRVITPNIQEALKASTAKYVATELITNREEVKDTFLNILKQRLSGYGIEILSVSVTDFKFSNAFTQAIEAKVTAEQQALEQKNILEKIRYEAQQQIIQADAARNATIINAEAGRLAAIIQAEGEANATIIRANATAQAIEIIQIQLTPEYIQYLTVLGWDGKLPIYWSGNGEMPILLIPTQTTNSTATNATITP